MFANLKFSNAGFLQRMNPVISGWNNHIFAGINNHNSQPAMIVNRYRTIQFAFVTFLCLFICFQPVNLFAQQHYKPLKQGEFEVVEEKTFFNPGAKISGSYEIYASDRREGFVTGSSLGGNFYQDISLTIQSRINTNIFLNATLGHESTTVSEQDRSYESQNDIDAGSSESGDGLDVTFDEAYLEYNHNPNAQLKIGRYYINIADRKGLVFEGEANAISQGCRIGTWCYNIGGARLGESGNAGVFWAQLDYPVYESGVVIADPWGTKPTRQEKSFTVEIFRVMYGGSDIPLAEYGGWTGEHSDAHDTYDDTESGDPIYFDNDGMEYIGLNVIWNYYDFDLHFTWSNMNGERDYFSKDSATGAVTEIGTYNVSGNAYLLDAGYRLSEGWKSTLRIFTAGGDSMSDDSDEIWEDDSKSYFEVKKGSFGDALIYFNGRNGIGDGHSVANLTFLALKFGYREPGEAIGVDLGLYNFMRTNSIYTNVEGDSPSKGSDIGREFDVTATWRLEERLFVKAYAAYFDPGVAYSANDSVRPEDSPSPFTMLGVSGQYTF